MIVGVPKEIKEEENRVAITPAGVTALVSHGHEVLIERDAGRGSRFSNRAYVGSGATVLDDAQEVWARADMIMKVKEPIPVEFPHLRPDLILFTYLHLAANPDLICVLRKQNVTGIGYETIQLDDGSLPLLTPMSEIAGRLALQVGAWCLQAENGGRGVLLGGASGVRPGKVVILGAGTVGSSACQVAAGMGAYVSLLDVNPARLRYVHDILGGRLTTLMSNRANVEEEVRDADLVVGSVLIAGDKTPVLLSRERVKQMQRGAAIVDVSIDQGGFTETSQPTTHRNPIYVEEHVVHYCVTNMPAIVPNTSTMALTNATLSYGQELADKGLLKAVRENKALARGLNTYQGDITHEGVASASGADLTRIEEVLTG
jgi:alanine dehydrogenase